MRDVFHLDERHRGIFEAYTWWGCEVDEPAYLMSASVLPYGRTAWRTCKVQSRSSVPPADLQRLAVPRAHPRSKSSLRWQHVGCTLMNGYFAYPCREKTPKPCYTGLLIQMCCCDSVARIYARAKLFTVKLILNNDQDQLKKLRFWGGECELSHLCYNNYALYTYLICKAYKFPI